MQINTKVFVVTGGGSGIGRQVVLGLVKRGARVAAVDLNEAGLAETARLAGAGERLTTHVVDVTDRGQVAALADEMLAAHGAIDGLLNVAGIIQPFVRVNDLDFSQMEKVMAVNFWGVINTTKTFLPLLLERPAASIVNVASMGAVAPVPGQTIYGASKAAVKMLTEGLYAELMDTNVAATVVIMGGSATDRGRRRPDHRGHGEGGVLRGRRQGRAFARHAVPRLAEEGDGDHRGEDEVPALLTQAVTAARRGGPPPRPAPPRCVSPPCRAAGCPCAWARGWRRGPARRC